MLKRSGPIARKKPLRKASKSLCAQKRAQRRAYAAAPDAEQAWCSACGKAGPTDHAHLFTQGRWEALRNNSLNWVRLCRSCHGLQEDKKAVFAARFPHIWAQLVEQMRELAPKAFAEFELRNAHLLPGGPSL